MAPSKHFGGDNGTEDIYKMTSKPRGFCCLFLNQNFYQSLSDNKAVETRLGADKDIDELRQQFESLHFKIYGQKITNSPSTELFDLTREEIKGKLDQIIEQKEELAKHDSFVAIFSSHGNISYISDKLRDPLLIDDILSKFSSVNCPHLADKPKIFIFLCCRGGKEPVAMKIKTYSRSGMNWDADDDDDEDDEEGEEKLVAIYENIIICFSTAKDYKSKRSIKYGTFYGQFLAKNLRLFSNKKDFEHILRKTAQDMSAKNITHNGKIIKMMSSVRLIGWQKKLYFNPSF